MPSVTASLPFGFDGFANCTPSAVSRSSSRSYPRMTARSSTDPSSLTLPGQRYCHQALDLCWPQRRLLYTELLRRAPDKMPGQWLYICQAFMQRRQDDREDRDAVPQVFPKSSFLYHERQVPVGGGDDPYVNMDVLLAANPLQHPVLQDPQQPDLGRQRQFTHLVKE